MNVNEKTVENEFARLFEEGLAEFESLLSERIGLRVTLELSMADVYEREAKQLSAKYNVLNPRITVLKEKKTAAIANARTITESFATKKKKSHAADTWIIEGAVYDKKKNPAAGVDIYLFDEKGQKVYGIKAKTDEQGRYLIEAGDVDMLPKRVKAGVSKKEISAKAFSPKAGARVRADIVLERLPKDDKKDNKPAQNVPKTPEAEPNPAEEKAVESNDDAAKAMVTETATAKPNETPVEKAPEAELGDKADVKTALSTDANKPAGETSIPDTAKSKKNRARASKTAAKRPRGKK